MKNIIKNSLVALVLNINSIHYSYGVELACSYNGTDIIYVNGVWNSPRAAEDTRTKIFDMYNLNSENAKTIDTGFSKSTAGDVSVDHVYNRTSSRLVDIAELASQIKTLKNDPYKYSKLAAGFFNVTLLHPNGSIHTLSEEGHKEYSDAKAKIIKDSFDDIRVADVIVLADRIKQSLDLNKKVIVVSHSQGNVFASESYRTLTSYYLPREVNKLPYYANMRIASPYKDTQIPSQSSILVDVDRVINNELISTHESVTHKLEPRLAEHVANAFSYDAEKLVFSQIFSSYRSGHEVLKIYLNDGVKSKSISSNGVEYETNMQQVFINQMGDLAKTVASNCEKIELGPLMANEAGGLKEFKEVEENKPEGDKTVLLKIEDVFVFVKDSEDGINKEVDIKDYVEFEWSGKGIPENTVTTEPEFKYTIPNLNNETSAEIIIKVKGISEKNPDDAPVGTPKKHMDTIATEYKVKILPACENGDGYSKEYDSCLTTLRICNAGHPETTVNYKVSEIDGSNKVSTGSIKHIYNDIDDEFDDVCECRDVKGLHSIYDIKLSLSGSWDDHKIFDSTEVISKFGVGTKRLSVFLGKRTNEEGVEERVFGSSSFNEVYCPNITLLKDE